MWGGDVTAAVLWLHNYYWHAATAEATAASEELLPQPNSAACTARAVAVKVASWAPTRLLLLLLVPRLDRFPSDPVPFKRPMMGFNVLSSLLAPISHIGCA